VDLSIAFIDKSGDVLDTVDETFAAILPGQRVAVADTQSNYGADWTNMASMEVNLSEPDWLDFAGPSGTYSFTKIKNTRDILGDIDTTARLKSTFTKELENPKIVVVYYRGTRVVVSQAAGGLCSRCQSFRILSAFRSIFDFSAVLRLPFFSCCDARALAFRACDSSGIGYLRSSGSPNSDLGSDFRFLLLSVAMIDASFESDLHLGSWAHERGWTHLLVSSRSNVRGLAVSRSMIRRRDDWGHWSCAACGNSVQARRRPQ
jgi:hypothetical protein